MEDTTFEDVLERDESKSIDENNIYTLSKLILTKQSWELFSIERWISITFAVIIHWSYVPQILVDMVCKHYILKGVLFGISFQPSIKHKYSVAEKFVDKYDNAMF